MLFYDFSHIILLYLLYHIFLIIRNINIYCLMCTNLVTFAVINLCQKQLHFIP